MTDGPRIVGEWKVLLAVNWLVEGLQMAEAAGKKYTVFTLLGEGAILRCEGDVK